MRISDWSADVCSSDLAYPVASRSCAQPRRADQDFGAARLLRWRHLPSRDRRLHGPDRRSYGHGAGRFGSSRSEGGIQCISPFAGVVSMARASSEDSANSQFYIMLLPRFTLDRKYTVFGRVIEGMEYVDPIARGEPPANPTRILQASIESDGKAPQIGRAHV